MLVTDSVVVLVIAVGELADELTIVTAGPVVGSGGDSISSNVEWIIDSDVPKYLVEKAFVLDTDGAAVDSVVVEVITEDKLVVESTEGTAALVVDVLAIDENEWISVEIRVLNLSRNRLVESSRVESPFENG